jgi:hypothetical protein
MESLNLSKWDEEFSPDCTAKGCDEKARWMGWVSHAFNSCPYSGFMCSYHRDKVEGWWGELLARTQEYELVCDRCKSIIDGPTDNHLRWIKL